jgi:hypothetical protein
MKPLPGISAKIVDEEGNELVPGADDGEHVTGYLGRSGIGIGGTPGVADASDLRGPNELPLDLHDVHLTPLLAYRAGRESLLACAENSHECQQFC